MEGASAQACAISSIIETSEHDVRYLGERGCILPGGHWMQLSDAIRWSLIGIFFVAASILLYSGVAIPLITPGGLP
jgi:hypothetical protein